MQTISLIYCTKCLESESELVRFVAQCITSFMVECNVLYCCERFSVLPNGNAFSAILIDRVCKNRSMQDDYNFLSFILELIVTKQVILSA